MKMQHYLLTYIIGGSHSEEEVKALQERVKNTLSETKIEKEELVGRKKLSYPILKNEYGFYVTLWFQANPEKIEEIRRKLKSQEEIIRSLITKINPEKLLPKAPAETKETPPQTPKTQKSTRTTAAKKPSAPKTTAKPEKAKKEPKIAQEIKAEEEKIKELDKKLEEILKE